MSNTAPSLLFVCVKNGGKSQMAAALARHFGGDAVAVHSAGTHPGSALNEQSRASVAEIGADFGDEFPKAIEPEWLDSMDRIIIVGTEASIDHPGSAPIEVWATDEPSKRGIEGEERMRLIRDDLATRVKALLADLDVPLAR